MNGADLMRAVEILDAADRSKGCSGYMVCTYDQAKALGMTDAKWDTGDWWDTHGLLRVFWGEPQK